MMRRSTIIAAATSIALGNIALAQSGGGDAELYMSGLAGPIGLEVDGRARAWLSQ